MKEVIKLYRSYLRNASNSSEDSTILSDPFLCMHIGCPSGSYDVNVEPAKDEVLFLDPSKVISVVEQLFEDIYGPLNTKRAIPKSGHEDRISMVKASTFDLLLARRSSHARTDTAGLQHPSSDIVQQDQPSQPYQLQLQHHTVEEAGLPEDNMNDFRDTMSENFHRNMYSADDDDFLEIENLLPIHDTLIDQDDDGELRSAKVTNPWSIAKINTSLRPNPGLRVRSKTPNLLIEPITPTASVCGTPPVLHRVPLSGPKLPPTPSLSSHYSFSTRTPMSTLQTPCPMTRRDAIEGEIGFTQGSEGGPQVPRHAIGLGASAKSLKSTTQLLSFQRASEMYVKDTGFGELLPNRFEARHGSAEACSSPQRSIASDHLHESPTMQNTRKPFRSPLNSLVTPSSLGATIHSCMLDRSTEPSFSAVRVDVDTGLSSTSRIYRSPKRISETAKRRLPLSSPNRCSLNMPQSQDMDFERRKKTGIKQYRQCQLKIGNSFINPGKLVSIQKQSGLGADVTNLSRSETSLLQSPNTDSATPFGTRFGDSSDIEHSGAPLPNNPSQHLFLSTSRAQAHTYTDDSDRDIVTDEAKRAAIEHNAAHFDITTSSTPFSKDDPRAYLIRHQQGLSGQAAGLKPTGVKVRRVKTMCLPFETIPVDMAIHDLEAILPEIFPASNNLQKTCSSLSVVDAYVTTGQNNFMKWTASSREVEEWQRDVQDLINTSYKTHVGQGNLAVPAVEIAMPMAIKAHVDDNV
jgi:DNA mismatch repair protein, C-terminal domain